MLAFIESGNFVYVLAVIAGIGILTKLMAAMRYSRLENQTEDVPAARDGCIRLWKNKFENTYRINKGLNDPDLFVERCVNQSKLMGILLNRWDRLNRILCSVCLVCSAAAVTVEVRSGVETAVVLGHFLTALSICSLMVFIEVFCENGEKRHRIGLNLADYFVNTLAHRLELGIETVTAEASGEAIIGAKGAFRGDIPEYKRNTQSENAEYRRNSRDTIRTVKRDVRGNGYVGETREMEDGFEFGANGAGGANGEEKEESSIRSEDRSREKLLKESLERIAASREPESEGAREKRSRNRREEDVRLIEEILREYLK